MPFGNLVSAGLQLQMLEVYLEKINDVLETTPEQPNREPLRQLVLRGSIRLDDVTFSYSTSESPVLTGVTIDVGPGSRIALVGRSGSGKSTVARLMAGLYKPIAGRVSFDGCALDEVDLSYLRRQLGIVTQDPQLFVGSIRRNIAYSQPDLDLDRVVEAARIACIHEEIIALPLGYDTPLVDRGASLSGGQRQRLAIARAIAVAPVILILDEATSHLDVVTESRITRNLKLLGCTQVVIAHRINTVRDADKIVVLDRGKVVQVGTHRELSESEGMYRDLSSRHNATENSHLSSPVFHS
jgi:ABC-type bacteriocin/lantibiotic exporter with double-glycine peptidase domain